MPFLIDVFGDRPKEEFGKGPEKYDPLNQPERARPASPPGPQGFLSGGLAALRSGGRKVVSEVEEGIKGIPEGVRTMVKGLSAPAPQGFFESDEDYIARGGKLPSISGLITGDQPKRATFVDRFRNLGTFAAGAAQAGLSIPRVIGAPLTGAARAVVSAPVYSLLPEGQEPSPEAEAALSIAEIPLTVAGAIKGHNALDRLRNARALQKEIQGVLKGQAADDYLTRGTKQKALTEGTPIERVFEEGPRGPFGTRGEARELRPPVTTPLRDPETGRIVIGGGKPKPGTDVPTREFVTTGGKPADMSLRDWIKLQAKGEREKVAAVADAVDDPNVADALPGHIKAGATAAKDSWLSSVPGWSTVRGMASKLDGITDAPGIGQVKELARLFVSPSSVLRNYPGGSEIVKKMIDAERQMHGLSRKWGLAFKELHDDVGKENFEAALKARDTGAIAANSQQAVAMKRFDEIFDEQASALSLDPDHPMYVLNYVPRIRQHLDLEKTRIRVNPDGFVSEDLLRMMPSQLRPYFSKARVTPGKPSDRYDLEYLIAHARAAARGSVFGTPQHRGVLEDIRRNLTELDTAPESVQNYVANFVNYMVGAPGAANSGGRLGTAVRNIEFVRAIGFNPMSAALNTMQRSVTFGEVSSKNFAKAFADEVGYYRGNKTARDLVKRSGMDLETIGPDALDKLDINQLEDAASKPEKFIGWLRDKSGYVFGATERGNRLHAFFAGYRDAIDNGLSESEALKYAGEIVDKTQFALGKAGRPAAYRSGLGATIGQFKNFTTKMGEYAYNNFMDMPRALKAGDTQALKKAATKFVKFWGAQYALGGPQVVPLMGEKLKEIDPIHWKGVMPYLGVAIKDQLGIGALDPRSWDTLLMYLPGPAINHALELGVGLGVPQIARSAIGVPSQENPADVAKRAKALTRSLGGVEAERIRRALTIIDGEEREPQTWAQTIPPILGGEKIPKSAPLIQKDIGLLEQLGRASGVTTPYRESRYEAMDKVREARGVYNRAKSAAAQMTAMGRRAEANRILAEAAREIESITGKKGVKLKLSRSNVKAQQEASRMDPLERLRKMAGKELGTYLPDEEDEE